MQILEYGNRDKPILILIHGFQSPYQVWNRYIDYYKEKFHIIVPILPGHNPQQKEDFLSFQDVSAEIENYCITRFGNEVYAVYGMSMGGVLAAHLWQNKRLHIKKLIFDGSPLVSWNYFMRKMSANFYLDVTHKTQKRDEKTLKQATELIISKEYFQEFLDVLDNMTDTTISNCINSVAKYEIPHDIDTPDTQVYFFHGTKMNELYAKKSAKYIEKNYSNVTVKCFRGKGHCENALMNQEVMIQELDRILM